jgi:Icc-related predicted phosphoesterase
MNHYGTTAQRHWERWLPERYATIQDPGSFFLTLGEEVARQIADLALDLVGDDPPGEDYLVKVGRLNMARLQAEEIVLRGAGPATTGTGSRPGRRRPGRGDPGTPAGATGDRRSQPPAVGGGERRAGGTGPGELAGQRFRPRSQDDLAPSGAVARIRANLAAVSALRDIDRDGSPATVAQQAVLARWSGWGAVPEVFDSARQDLTWAREELASFLTSEELAAAARNTLNAHYTDAYLVQATWAGVQQLGFTGGRVLEPGCGSGNFIAFSPEGAQVTGVELEPVTAQIAAALYPDAQIRNELFAVTRAVEASFDLVIGNVPFGAIRCRTVGTTRAVTASATTSSSKSLHLTRPGGLMAVLTSRYTMDARNPAARREIAALADLVGAVRLLSGAHQRAAATNVITDLLILRRREPGREPDATAWEQARMITLDGSDVPVNEYLLSHPGNVLGELRSIHGAYRADDLAVTAVGDSGPALAMALEGSPDPDRTRLCGHDAVDHVGRHAHRHTKHVRVVLRQDPLGLDGERRREISFAEERHHRDGNPRLWIRSANLVHAALGIHNQPHDRGNRAGCGVPGSGGTAVPPPGHLRQCAGNSHLSSRRDTADHVGRRPQHADLRNHRRLRVHDPSLGGALAVPSLLGQRLVAAGSLSGLLDCAVRESAPRRGYVARLQGDPVRITDPLGGRDGRVPAALYRRYSRFGRMFPEVPERRESIRRHGAGLGGDITGKILVPIVEIGNGQFRYRWLDYESTTDADGVVELEREIRRAAAYSFRTDPDGLAAFEGDPAVSSRVFVDAMESVVRQWVALAEERLAGTGVQCYITPGNDDDLGIDPILLNSDVVQNPESEVIAIRDSMEMITTGYSNPTPWGTPREEPEDALLARISAMAEQVRHPERVIFYLHVPPYGSGLDTAPCSTVISSRKSRAGRYLRVRSARRPCTMRSRSTNQ